MNVQKSANFSENIWMSGGKCVILHPKLDKATKNKLNRILIKKNKS